MELNERNYYSTEMNQHFFSVSQFKAFEKCEAAALADLRGSYRRADTAALLIGSYVDAFFSGEMEAFYNEHPDVFNKRTGELKADYRRAEAMIERIQRCDLLLEYLTGDAQAIRTGELFGYPWKIKMDFCDGRRIVDLKTVKDFGHVWDPEYGYRDWIQYWNYDLQGAIYQRIEQISSGRPEPLPFYIVAVTKEPVPDIGLFQIPQPYLDAALLAHGVEARIDRFALIKDGIVEPSRCGHCDYCKETKVITEPEIYEMEGE